MAGKSISQLIKLEGAEEIQRLLAGVGNVGEKAMAQIAAATGEATKKLERVSNAVASAERSFASVGAASRNFGTQVSSLGNNFNQFERALASTVTKATLFTGAIVAAGAGLARFVLNGIKAADDIDEQAQALGLTTQRYQELGFAAGESGVKAGQFAAGMKKFSQEVENESAKQAKSIVTFLEQSSRSFDDWGGRIKLVGNQTGNTFSIIAEGAQKLQKDLAAQGINRPLFLIQEQLRKLALGGAAAREEFERLTGLKLGPNSDGLDKLREKAEGTKNAIKTLGIELKKNAEGGADISDALGQMADKFKDLPDGANKTALAMDAFGRAAGPAMIPFLNQGREGIEALLAEARRLGLFLSKDQIEASGKAARAYDILARAATTAKNSFAAAFAPVTTAVATGLTRFLSENKTAVDEFARSLNDKAIPYITAFFNLLAGRDDGSDAAGRLIAIKERAEAVGTTLKNVATVIGQAFSVILAVLDQVAAGFNTVFGTNLSGAELGIILLITKLVGGFALLAAGVRLTAVLFTTFFAALRLAATGFALVLTAGRALLVVLAALVSFPVAIAAALIIAGALIIAYWDDIKRIVGDVWDFIKDVVGRGFAGAWEWIKTAAQSAWEFVKTKAQEAWDVVKKLVTEAIAGAWDWVVKTFDDAIAKLKKKAQDAVDFIKNLLTNSADKTGGSAIPGATPGETPVPLLGGRDRFENLPQSQNIEDRRGEAGGSAAAEATATLESIRTLAEDVALAVAAAFDGLKVAAETVMQGIIATMTGTADLIGTTVTGAFQRASDASTNLIAQLATSVQQMIDALASSVASVIAGVDAAIAAVVARLEQALQRARELAAAAAAAGAGGGGGSGGATVSAAGGGFVWGPGTSTSDSIPARLSRGEFVQRAAAVRYYGADLMAALNALRIPRDILRGFSMGGLVDGMRASLAMPAMGFAGGGLVPAASGVGNLGTLDLRTDSGTVRLTVVRNDAVDQLQRMNVRRQLSRNGKPARGT